MFEFSISHLFFEIIFRSTNVVKVEPTNVETQKIESISPSTKDNTKEEQVEEDQEKQPPSPISSELVEFPLLTGGKAEKAEKR